MLKSKKPEVQVGDRFNKAGDPLHKVWQVTAVAQAVDGIVHARLRSCDQQANAITIAAGVLSDPDFWHPAHAG